MALAVSADGQHLLLGTEHGVMQSTDDGTTWTQNGGALPGSAQVLALTIAPTSDTMIAATTNGMYRRSGTTDVWTPTALKKGDDHDGGNQLHAAYQRAGS